MTDSRSYAWELGLELSGVAIVPNYCSLGSGQYSRRVAHIPLPDGAAGIRALFAFRPEPAGPMADLANILLHAPNSLTPGERELIAAYVSSLNDCTYCLDSHAAIASWHFGNDDGFVRSVVADPATAVISDKLRALLDIAARVQQSGSLVRDDRHRARAPAGRDRRRDSRHGPDRGGVLHVQSLR